MLHTLIPFIVLLGILIFVHELGHFLVAKKLGIKVLRFSLGFGPILLRSRRGETEYALSAIPLGGYVKLYGEQGETDEGEELDEKRSFSHRPVGHRMAVVFAGPVMNILLAILLFTVIALPGRYFGLPVVDKVAPQMPAETAGLQSGDRIIAVNGTQTATWEAMSEAIRASGGREIELTVERGGETLPLLITPVERPGALEGEKAYMIGIQGPGEFAREPMPFWRAPLEGARMTWAVVDATLSAVWKLVSGQGSRDDLMGPIGIAKETGEAARRGPLYFFTLMAVLSVNLGVLNLLPIPVLDGGHLLFFGIEAVRGKPVKQRNREIAQQMGLAILLALMVYVIVNDIFRIAQG